LIDPHPVLGFNIGAAEYLVGSTSDGIGRLVVEHESVSAFLASETCYPIGTLITDREGFRREVVGCDDSRCNLIHPVNGQGFHVFPNSWGFDIRAFGAKIDGNTDDTDAVQAAINAAEALAGLYGAGAPAVYFPEGATFLNARGTIENPAYDDGSGEAIAYNGATANNIAAEMPTTLTYCLKTNSSKSINFVGAGQNKSVIVGPWGSTMGASSNFPAAICIDSKGLYQWGMIRDLTIKGFFIGIMQLDGYLVETTLDCMLFSNCGIGLITWKMERCRIGNIHFVGCVAGWVNGGQWRTRADNYSEEGGWMDKNTFAHVTGQGFPALDSEIFFNFDIWFDNNFWKSKNNITRKYPSGGSGTPATSNIYRGVSGHTVALLSRYYRPNVSNVFGLLTHMISPRPAMEAQCTSNLRLNSVYLERVGTANGEPAEIGSVVGDGIVNDPYRTGRYPDLVLGGGHPISPTIIGSLEIQHSAGASVSPAGRRNVCVETIRVSQCNESAPTRTGAGRSEEYVDAGTETIGASKTWAANQQTNGYFFGDVLAENKWVTTSFSKRISIAQLEVKLPQAGTYLITAVASDDGSHNRAYSATFLVVANVASAVDYLVAAQPMAPLIMGRYKDFKCDLTLSDPNPEDFGMTITATQEGRVARICFVVKAIKIG
jgi:hypothetical protein